MQGKTAAKVAPWEIFIDPASHIAYHILIMTKPMSTIKIRKMHLNGALIRPPSAPLHDALSVDIICYHYVACPRSLSVLVHLDAG